MKKEKLFKTQFFIGAVLFVACAILLPVLNYRFPDNIFYIGSIQITVTSISGMLSVIQICSYILLLYGNLKYGIVLCCISTLSSIISVCHSVLILHRYGSIPGFLLAIAGFCLAFLYAHQLSELKKQHAELERISVTDSLTGLYNRFGIYEEITNLIEENRPFYLLFLDLDNFKNVNDSVGHRAGDLLLQRVGRHWKSVDNPDGAFGRNGGDEFLMIVPETKKFDINTFMKQCFDALQGEIFLDEYDFTYTVSVSIGVSYFPLHGRTADDLVKAADDAMYRVKSRGGNGFEVFTSSEKS